jgi:DMSO reductase anchor subunit
MRNLANEQTVAPISPKKGFRIHLLVFVLTIPTCWLIWFFTDRTYLWPLWQTITWGIGLLFHYLGVYVFKSKKTIKNY